MKNFNQDELLQFLKKYKEEKGCLRGALKEVEIAFIDYLYEIVANITEEELREDSLLRVNTIKKLEKAFRNLQYFQHIYWKEKSKRR